MSSINLRQRILDHVHAHQHSSPAEVAANMEVLQDTVSRALREMYSIGEMSREKSLDENGQPYRYTAIAETAQKAKFHNPSYERKQKALSKPPSKPGYYRHDPDSHKPYTNQGGQGSCAPRQASMMDTIFW